MTTQLTIDLRAVAYCKYYYTNLKGDTRRLKPRFPTVNGYKFDEEAPCFLPFGASKKTMLEYATQQGLLDVWKPVCILQFRNNHSMCFTGEQAIKMKKRFDAHIYKRN